MLLSFYSPCFEYINDITNFPDGLDLRSRCWRRPQGLMDAAELQYIANSATERARSMDARGPGALS